jgi:SET domain-containing protein
MYKPLPKELRLGFSDIHDIGVFAKEKIKIGHDFGISHLKIDDNLYRMPLGGFINHSDTPNCTKTMVRVNNYKVWKLITLKDIKEGVELTLEYTFYKIYDDKRN